METATAGRTCTEYEHDITQATQDTTYWEKFLAVHDRASFFIIGAPDICKGQNRTGPHQACKRWQTQITCCNRCRHHGPEASRRQPLTLGIAGNHLLQSRLKQRLHPGKPKTLRILQETHRPALEIHQISSEGTVRVLCWEICVMKIYYNAKFHYRHSSLLFCSDPEMTGSDRGEEGPLVQRTPTTGRSTMRSTCATSWVKSWAISKVSPLLPSSRVRGDISSLPETSRRPDPGNLPEGKNNRSGSNLGADGRTTVSLTSALGFQTWVSCVSVAFNFN